MRGTILGVLVVILAFMAPLIWERLMNAAPELAWRILSFVFILAGLAWAILSDPIYKRLAEPAQNPLGSTLIVILGAAIVAGSAWWFFVVTQPEQPRLEFFATTTMADYPPGTTIAGIPWRSPYVEIHLAIGNPTGHTYEDLDLLLRPDKLVAAISQVSNIENVRFETEVRSFRMEFQRQTGQRFAIPVVLIATDDGYHVRCSRLPAKTSLQIVMATVTMAGTSDEPEKDPFSKSYRIRIGLTKKKSGRKSSVWYGYEDRPDSVHGAKSPPTTLTVDGNYIAAQQTQTVSERIEVRDLLGEAAKQIRSQE